MIFQFSLNLLFLLNTWQGSRQDIKINLNSCLDDLSQWRIQDFSEDGGPTPEEDTRSQKLPCHCQLYSKVESSLGIQPSM